MSAPTHNLALVERILDRWLPSGDLEPLSDRLAEDVELTVTGGDDDRHTHSASGKAAVLDYFASLGDLVTCWRVKLSWSGARVVVLGEESFTLRPGDIEVQSEFTMVFELRDGLIVRFHLVEDRPALAGVRSSVAG